MVNVATPKMLESYIEEVLKLKWVGRGGGRSWYFTMVKPYQELLKSLVGMRAFSNVEHGGQMMQHIVTLLNLIFNWN